VPASQDSPDPFAPVRAFIQAELVANSLPSLAVAVARAGAIVWEEGFGWADRERREPATPHTLYSLASISKPLTATGLMVLRERGLIDLDRPIDDYLGEARLRARVGDGRAATVRRVANHTAGLPLHYHFFYADEPRRRPPMDETIRRYGNLVTAPGERFQYSNLGYGLLDHVIERLSGKGYADFMREEVFLPLGLTRASVGVGPGLAPYAATRYGGDGVAYPAYDFDHRGGSAAYCSAHDLARFGLFHLKAHLADQKAILPDAAIEQMQTETAPAEDGRDYGIGWIARADELGYRTIGHSGGMGGVNTHLMLVPSEGIVVVTLANASCALPHRAAEEILAALLPPYAERLIQHKAERAEEERKQREQGDDKAEPPFQPPPELLGHWRGLVHTYTGDRPLDLWFKDSGDVHAQFGGQLKTLVNDARLADDRLTGQMLGDIGTPDANHRPYRLRLDLKRRGETLSGAVTAISHLDGDEGGAPGRRVGNALSHWAELTKLA
jgi:CubicO group peptidase (beta-lactamase class C family)